MSSNDPTTWSADDWEDRLAKHAAYYDLSMADLANTIVCINSGLFSIDEDGFMVECGLLDFVLAVAQTIDAL